MTWKTNGGLKTLFLYFARPNFIKSDACSVSVKAVAWSGFKDTARSSLIVNIIIWGICACLVHDILDIFFVWENAFYCVRNDLQL